MKTKISGLVRLIADARAPSIDDLRDRMSRVLGEAEAIQAAADAEGRELTQEQSEQVANLFEAYKVTKLDIDRRQTLAAMKDDLNSPRPRVTQPAAAPSSSGQPQAGDTSSSRPYTSNVRTVAEQTGTGGFKHMGEMMMSVRGSVVGGRFDERLRPFAAAGTPNSEGIGADGGFLLPPDFRTEIMQKVEAEESLLTLCDQQAISGNQVSYPLDSVAPWDGSKGVQATWEGEGSQIAQSRHGFGSFLVPTKKLSALVGLTDELVQDVAALTSYVGGKVAAKFAFKLNDAIINGDGVNKPTGIMKSGALVTVAKESSQSAAGVIYQNILNMWARCYAPCRKRAVWLATQDIEPQLGALMISSGSSVSFPAYVPPNGIVQNPFGSGTLMGRPIIFTEACKVIGTPGDIILADLSQYVAPVKTGGMRSDTSIHFWFDQSITAFRFSMRVGGAPWWDAPISRGDTNNTSTFSCFVALAARP